MKLMGDSCEGREEVRQEKLLSCVAYKSQVLLRLVRCTARGNRSRIEVPESVSSRRMTLLVGDQDAARFSRLMVSATTTEKAAEFSNRDPLVRS